MQNAPQFGLGHMPSVEPAIASLIVSPEEALRANPRCPNSQYRATDKLLCRSYDTGARTGRLGNSLSHFLLGLSTSLETSTVDSSALGLLDASLQTFALMSRELGRLLSTLTLARRQVWLAQSPLTEPCRRTLRNVPVVPGELFGAAATDALERTVQANRTRDQLVALHRRPPQHSGAFVSRRGAPRGSVVSPALSALATHTHAHVRHWHTIRDGWTGLRPRGLLIRHGPPAAHPGLLEAMGHGSRR